MSTTPLLSVEGLSHRFDTNATHFAVRDASFEVHAGGAGHRGRVGLGQEHLAQLPGRPHRAHPGPRALPGRERAARGRARGAERLRRELARTGVGLCGQHAHEACAWA